MRGSFATAVIGSAVAGAALWALIIFSALKVLGLA
jgi:hypothetical protein